jgi:UDP-N-acetylmuramate dehydrogenase
MKYRTHYPLHHLNTFGVEATAARYVRFESVDEIRDFLREDRFYRKRCLIMGGGSNLLFVNDFDGTILHPAFKGIEVLDDDGRRLRVKALAGETWDDLVAFAVAHGWGGLENLSFIPGDVGASAVQNIGAYGVEVEALIDRVEAIELATGKRVFFSAADCGFGYRRSNFKGPWQGRFIITAVVFNLDRRSEPVLDYPGVKAAVAGLGPTGPATVRQAVIAIRQNKLPDPAVIGNAGSFFKNPVIDGNALGGLLSRYPDLPHYPQSEDRFKLAAGWLIERCGWKGKRVGRAGVHDRQALVLVNLGGAAGREILELSEQVKRAVADTFGIGLEREVTVVA